VRSPGPVPVVGRGRARGRGNAPAPPPPPPVGRGPAPAVRGPLTIDPVLQDLTPAPVRPPRRFSPEPIPVVGRGRARGRGKAPAPPPPPPVGREPAPAVRGPPTTDQSKNHYPEDINSHSEDSRPPHTQISNILHSHFRSHSVIWKLSICPLYSQPLNQDPASPISSATGTHLLISRISIHLINCHLHSNFTHSPTSPSSSSSRQILGAA